MNVVDSEKLIDSMSVFLTTYYLLSAKDIPTINSPEEQWMTFLKQGLSAYMSKQTKLKDSVFHTIMPKIIGGYGIITYTAENGDIMIANVMQQAPYSAVEGDVWWDATTNPPTRKVWKNGYWSATY